ncbi:MAG: L-aspartate oxidase [Caulobacteraceae bacterium]
MAQRRAITASIGVQRHDFDGVIIIGAGLAGLSAALAAAPRRTLVLTAAPLGEACASAWAQGGLAAALSADDDPAFHAADTLAAGAGLCDQQAVAILTGEGPAAVRRLAALGAPFDRAEDGGFIQSLEAAHGRPRVARVGGDGAGAAIMEAVVASARAAAHIEIRQRWRALALLTDTAGAVRGALFRAPGGDLVEITAAATLLATGGLGGLFRATTNPRQALGEGLALAALAGAGIRDPEFIQFHPTAIDIGADPAPLATEALRGEGATLINRFGEAFMAARHPLGDLAPRDVVARGIAAQVAAGAGAFLDARVHPGAAFPELFPGVFAACAAGGIDPRVTPIPVVPAAHYHMGGIAADADGRTSLEGLFAAGECAAAGVHGANRLASNSLLEAAVFGSRAGAAAGETGPRSSLPLRSQSAAPDLPPAVLAELRGRMSACAGVVRHAAGLAGLLAWIEATRAACGAAPALVAAALVVQAAVARRESRGAHFRSDWPSAAAAAVSSRLVLPPPASRLAA